MECIDLQKIPMADAQLLSQVLHAALGITHTEPVLTALKDGQDTPTSAESEEARNIILACLDTLSIPEKYMEQVARIFMFMHFELNTLIEYGSEDNEIDCDYTKLAYGINWSMAHAEVLQAYIDKLHTMVKLKRITDELIACIDYCQEVRKATNIAAIKALSDADISELYEFINNMGDKNFMGRYLL